MEHKSKIRKSAELSISMTVISTLLLAACGGGSGGSGAVANNNVTPNAVPALGAFVDGSTVIVFDNSGRECTRGKTVNGSAALTINTNTCPAPLIVQAGINGDLYFNEATGANVALVGNGVRAVVPAATATPFGVTALTEIAAAGLVNASGVVNTNAAGVTAQNNTIAALLSNGLVPDPLAVPQAAGLIPGGTVTKANNAYGALLAMLGNLAGPTGNAQTIANSLASDLADGTWDGFIGPAASAVAATTPSAAAFGAAMVAAASTASVRINAVSVPPLPFNAYVPASGVTAAVAATKANNGTAPINPINTAKKLFASLRTSLIQLTNPTQTAFFDTLHISVQNDLRNTVMPEFRKVRDKISLMNDAVLLLDGLKANGLAACNPLIPATCYGAIQVPDLLIPGNIKVQRISYKLGNFAMMMGNMPTCTTTSHPAAQFVAGTLPPGIMVRCNADIDPVTFQPTGHTTNTFRVNITPAATANSYTYASFTIRKPFDFMGIPGAATTIGGLTGYTGTASMIRTVSGQTSSLAFSGQLAADGVSHEYDQVALNMLRTFPSGTLPVGAPAGFQLAKFDITGSIASYQIGGLTPLGSIALLTGSTESQLEDANGWSPTLQADRNLGKTTTLMMQAKTVSTQIDGTTYANAYVCDLSGFNCGPTSLSFTGKLTNLANATVGLFATGTLSDNRDFTAYNSTLPISNTNRIKDVGSFSGTVTNSTVTPAAVYRVTLNEDRSVDNQNTVSFIYTDSLNTTVSGNAVINTTPGVIAPHVFTVTSGAVIGNLSRTAPALGASALSGLMGSVYVGAVAPANLIGTITGNMINYTDGTFATLQ